MNNAHFKGYETYLRWSGYRFFFPFPPVPSYWSSFSNHSPHCPNYNIEKHCFSIFFLLLQRLNPYIRAAQLVSMTGTASSAETGLPSTTMALTCC